MPLFMSESDLESLRGDPSAIAERADTRIRDLQQQLETERARADAAAILTEQNCSLVEQKYLSISAQLSQVQEEKAHLQSTLENQSSDLAHANAKTHKLELDLMKKDNDMERLRLELSEEKKAKRELHEILDQKCTELQEKNSLIKSYLDKVVIMTNERSVLEGKQHESEAEIVRLQAAQARLSQEKELLGQHNTWMNEELSEKVTTLLAERHSHTELEIKLHSSLSEAERSKKEAEDALHRSKERTKDLESKLRQSREELRFLKEEAATKEEHLLTEITTATKLAELFKLSSEEWSRKASDLEGVIKALETHLNQVEERFKKKAEEDLKVKEKLENEAADLRQSLEKASKEIETLNAEKQSNSLALVKTDVYSGNHDLALEVRDDSSVLPIVPAQISSTAFAASILRDGWTLTKLYVKYQEVVDAWRHESQERRQLQALLERVLREIEEKAEMILDERAEHLKLAEAYDIMEEKLRLSMEEQNALENSVLEFKAELKRKEREIVYVQKEVTDLQTEVAALLKEYSDTQEDGAGMECVEIPSRELDSSAADKVISERFLTFKDIRGLVQQHTQLRTLVRTLSEQNEVQQKELKELFDTEIRKRTDEASKKVATILKKSEEQSDLIESLHGTIGMYKRLYEEQARSHFNIQHAPAPLLSADANNEDFKRLYKSSQDEVGKVREEVSKRVKFLEEELDKARKESLQLRLERDRFAVEATYAREQLQTISKESENHRKEMDAVLARNVEFSQTITEYQKKMRQNYERVELAEEKARKLSIEVNVLEREKELISNAEKRASNEVSSLSERVYRLQATLDNLHAIEEARGETRTAEKKRLEEELNRMQKEWAEAKQNLEQEQCHVRNLTNERDRAVSQAMDHVESMSKQLSDLSRIASESEARVRVFEARCADLETRLKKKDENLQTMSSGDKFQTDGDKHPDTEKEIRSALDKAKEEIEQLREDRDAYKNHTEQYKKIAQANESALKEMEDVYNRFKLESDKAREVLESDISSLREKLSSKELFILEKEMLFKKSNEENETAIQQAIKEIDELKDLLTFKQKSIEEAEKRIDSIKGEFEKEHELRRVSQSNYERQVLLQADTIRELKIVSEKLSKLEDENAVLRGDLEKAESDLNITKVEWEMEKTIFVSEQIKLQKNIKELDEQNKILLDRLEAAHINIAEQEQKSGSAQGNSPATSGENDLQSVIRYMRRSKETAETEISLLKQERLRFQKEVEAAVRSADDARASLRKELESSRVNLFSEEEFRSLQAQVKELNLLRESNAQLREENRHNFEECQELREKNHKAQAEVELLRQSMSLKDIDLEALRKEMENQKSEIARWQKRYTQVTEKFSGVDLDELERLKSELASIQDAFKASQIDLETSRKEVELSREKLAKLEQDLTQKEERISELDAKLQSSAQSELSAKADVDKFKRNALLFKRKNEALTKEKDLAIKEKDSLVKQVEDMKSSAGKRIPVEVHRSESSIRQEITAQHEQAQKELENLLKEKDTRIQSLERTLEREREDLKKEREELRKEREELRKEKAKRLKDQKTFIDAAHRVQQEKTKFLEEMNVLRKEKDQYIEQIQTTGLAIPEAIVKADIEERTLNYVAAVQDVAEVAMISTPETKEDKEREIQTLRAMIQEKERDVKRKTGRKIIRPKIEPAVGHSESQTEPNETGFEMIVENFEAEPDVPDEGKILPSSAGVSEAIPAGSFLGETSGSEANANANMQIITIPIPVEAVANVVVPGLRKRTSSSQHLSEEGVSDNEMKVQKRLRGAADMDNTGVIVSAQLEKDSNTEEAPVMLESRIGSENLEDSMHVELADILKESSVTEITGITEGNATIIQEVEEATTSIVSVESFLVKIDQDFSGKGLKDEISCDGSLSNEALMESGKPESEEKPKEVVMAPTLEQASDVVRIDESCTTNVEVLNTLQVSEGDEQGRTVSKDTESFPPVDDKVDVDAEHNEMEVEEGEIEGGAVDTERVEAVKPEGLSLQDDPILVVALDDATDSVKSVKMSNEEEGKSSQVVAESSSEIAVPQQQDVGGSETETAVTRQAGKNTTISIAERAMERAHLRRTGISPPAPGRGRGRAVRLNKRTAGSGRGRGTPETPVQRTESEEQTSQGATSKPGNSENK